MNWNLNPSFVASVSRKLASIEVTRRQASVSSKRQGPDARPVDGRISLDEVENITSSKTNKYGHRIDIARQSSNGDFTSVEGPSFKIVSSLAAQLQDKCQLEGMVSIAFIEDFIANFVFDRIVNEIDSSSFLSSFMAHVESSIEEFEFWFPISGANGNVEFAFGGCKIAPTCPNFDVFLNAMESGKEENRDRAGAFDNKVQVLRRNYGKCLWIAVPQTGELKYASQSAYEKSLEICDILRAFIVESYRPDRFATLIPGRPYSVGDFSISQTQNGFSVHESVLPGSEIIWFDQKRLRDLKSLGLYLIDEPVKAERKTGFDRVLLRTLELMGNGVGQQSTAQKVVLLCAALEFLFCDKQGEAIVATMPKRAAMLIGANLDDRKRIVQTIKMAYNDRSRSVHTGGKVAVAEHTFDFLRLCFTLTAFLPRLIGQFESKEKFIQALEDRQLA